MLLQTSRGPMATSMARGTGVSRQRAFAFVGSLARVQGVTLVHGVTLWLSLVGMTLYAKQDSIGAPH
jgi:hypothetical protein